MENKMSKDIIDFEKKFQNIQSFDELDFTELQNMGKGQTPQSIEQKCLDLCTDYLGGNWSQQTVNSIQVKRITGGLVNQIYQCSIREPNEREGTPQEVCVKLFGSNPFDPDKSRVKEVVISLIFSENNLGPKIYGVFKEGLIQEFYKHRSYIGGDQKNPVLIRKVCESLAKIHSLELPLKKYPELFQLTENNLREGFQNGSFIKYINEYNCQTFKKYDLITELNWINDVIKRVKSPILFTHNDYRSSNLMITEPNDELVVCDFDLSGYGYRGNDFVWLMKEWGNRKQMDLKSIEGLPLNDEFKSFIEVYVEECIRIHGKSYIENPINSVDHILKEAKLFLLYSYIWLISTLLERIHDKDFILLLGNLKVIMEMCDSFFQHFLTLKAIFEEQMIFE